MVMDAQVGSKIRCWKIFYLHFYLIFIWFLSSILGGGLCACRRIPPAPVGAETSKIHISWKKKFPGILTSYICRAAFFFFGANCSVSTLMREKKNYYNFPKSAEFFFFTLDFAFQIFSTNTPPGPPWQFWVNWWFVAFVFVII